MSKRTLGALQRDIGKAVCAARKRAKMTQRALAGRLGTQQANISRIERGMQNLSLELLLRLDEVLGLRLELKIK